MITSNRPWLAIDGGEPVRQRPFPSWPNAPSTALAAMEEVLSSGHWWQSGNGRAEDLEEWLTEHFRVAAAVAVANGTLALELALRALGIGPGDEVLIPGLTFFSTASAVSVVGALPVPVDVRGDTLCLDADRLADSLSPRTRAIIAVHLAGQPANLTAIQAFAAQHRLALIEDCAQTTSAEWQSRRVGSVGDLATLSFQSAKLLSAGEGGAVLVREGGALAESLRRLANCGRDRGARAYDHSVVGTNARMTEFQAALLMTQTEGIDPLWQRRRETAERLSRELTPVGSLQPVAIDARATRVDWYMFLIRLTGVLDAAWTSGQLAAELTAEGIPASPIYPAIPDVPVYRQMLADRIDPCLESRSAAASVVWLHHRLLLDGDRGVDDIVAACQKVARAHADD